MTSTVLIGSGTVVDEDKRAVGGAAVNVAAPSQGFGGFPGADGGRAPVVTGPDGRFAIYTPREGDVIVDATKKGLPTAKSSTFRVAAGERKSGITLTIPRGIVLTGRVIDANGKPLSGVSVVANSAEGNGPGGAGMRRMIVNLARLGSAEDETVQTGSDGVFTMRVKEGMYDVVFKREVGQTPGEFRRHSKRQESEPVPTPEDR